MVLRALRSPSFKPLQTAELRPLSPPAGFGIGQASRRPAGTPGERTEFGPNDCKVVFEPRQGYVPKVLSTPFRAHVITL